MNVVQNRNIFLSFSITLVVISWLAIFILGLRPGIDLRGGTQWQIKFAKYDQDNPNWKNGLSPLYKKIRATAKYRNWKKSVLERDRFQCIFCSSKNRPEIDHIKPFSQIIRENKITTVKDSVLCEELFDINNGRTLCHICHVNTPTYAVMID